MTNTLVQSPEDRLARRKVPMSSSKDERGARATCDSCAARRHLNYSFRKYANVFRTPHPVPLCGATLSPKRERVIILNKLSLGRRGDRGVRGDGVHGNHAVDT